MVRKELIKILGAEYVFDDNEILDQYSRDRSFFPSKRPDYVVKPKNSNEVKDIVRLANEYKLHLVPSSSGIHFNGATIPAQGGIVVDLRRMNKILKVDERNRAVRIEPGVTWGQLQDELKKQNLRALNPLLPHSSKSVLTSHLEVEPMLIPKFEYGEPICTMEIILPNGDLFRTGSASGPGDPEETQTDLVGPYGPGVDFFRLFQGAQGTLGIVTWMNIKAEPLPRFQKLFFTCFYKIEDLVNNIYKIQKRMLGYECFALNSHNLAMILAEKWPDDFKTLKEILPPWTLIHCLAGTHRLPREKVEYQEKDLMEVSQELGIDPQPIIPGVGNSKRVILELLQRPWTKEPYWKDRLKGNHFDIFFYIPMDHLPDFITKMYKLTAKYRYPTSDIGEYLQPIEYGRICHFEFSFSYDPEDPNEVELVKRLYTEASGIMIEMGALFTRPYGVWAEMAYSRNAEYTAVTKELKRLFDPNNIMNPGRLCF